MVKALRRFDGSRCTRTGGGRCDGDDGGMGRVVLQVNGLESGCAWGAGKWRGICGRYEAKRVEDKADA